MADNEEGITVDPDRASVDSTYGSDPHDWQSDTHSIFSSIARGRLENGRRYQAMKEDDYWSPSDEQQFKAFEIGHILFLVLDYYEPNPLFRAPIGELPQNILDIGTGQGSWAMDVADRYPSATVRGVDIFPPPVTWTPPNCIFEVDDVLREWTWKQPFDLIHMRLMYGAFPDDGWDTVYKQAYEALQPGGWLEQMEFDVRVRSDDGSLTEQHELWGWGDMFIRCALRAGRSLNIQETMRASIEKAGFVDVHEERMKVPLGPWPKNKVLKEAGKLQNAHWNAALEGWAMWLLTHFGEPVPWMSEEVQVYLAKVRAELRDSSIHGYNYTRRVWARKPAENERGMKVRRVGVETSR